jgi:hypothetical protein
VVRFALFALLVTACVAERVDDSPRVGTITIANIATTRPAAAAGNAYAAFHHPVTCEREFSIGPCRVTKNCADDVSDGRYFSAGAITFTNTTEPVTLSPFSDGSYQVLTSDQTLFAPGDSMTIAAEGDEVPALENQLVAPASTVVTSRIGTARIDRTQDLELTWTGATTGDVFVAVSGGASIVTAFDCRLPAGPGHGSIPAAVLAQMNRQGLFSIGSVSSLKRAIDHWSIELAVVFESTWADGSLAQTDVEFAD